MAFCYSVLLEKAQMFSRGQDEDEYIIPTTVHGVLEDPFVGPLL